MKKPIYWRNKVEIFISWSKDKSKLLALETKKFIINTLYNVTENNIIFLFGGSVLI